MNTEGLHPTPFYCGGYRILSEHSHHKQETPQPCKQNTLHPLLFQLSMRPLFSKTHAPFQSYDCTCNPGVSNEFATAAFRLGHTLINGLFKIAKEDFQEEEMKDLGKMFFNPGDLVKNNFCAKVLMGMASQHSQNFDKLVI